MRSTVECMMKVKWDATPGHLGATAVFISVSVFGVNEEEGRRVECTTKVKRGATPGPWGPTGPSGHIVHLQAEPRYATISAP